MSSEFPSELKYTREHEWVSYDEATSLCIVGITTFAAEQLGDVVAADLPAKGDTIATGDVFGSVESVKAVSDLYAPVSGTVVDVNTALDGSPELINEDPYDEGWIVKLELSDADELKSLMDAEAYAAFIAEQE